MRYDPILVCKFNNYYENFLSKIYKNVITNFARDFDLSALSKIEIVEVLHGSSDGRLIGNDILLSKRLFDLLPTLDIESLENNSVFNLLISTLFHELCHLNERSITPNIHSMCDRDIIDIDYFVALVWIEYIVELKTNLVFKRKKTDFRKAVALNEWKICKSNFNDFDTSNYFYLVKVLPYILADLDDTTINEYSKQIKNTVVKRMVIELYYTVTRIKKYYPFDDFKILNQIKNILLHYENHFLNFPRERD